METPLVAKDPASSSEPDYLPVKSFKEAKFIFWTETVSLWRIAGPVALSCLFQYLKNSSTAIYAGHIGDIELSSISVYHGVMSSIYFSLLVSDHLSELCVCFLFIR